MDVGLALIVCFVMVSMTAVQSQIHKGPVNSLKRTGDSVTLECVTVNRNCDQIDWAKVEGLQSPKLVYRNGAPDGGMLNRDIYPPQRYSVNSTGGCSLTITRLEISDSGRFMCKHSLTDGEVTRSCILIVINVTESCMSNVRSNALDKGDGYSLWSAIKVPPKSVEPSNVTVAFHIKTADETETTDEEPLLTLKTTLTGTATKENITRSCKASFPPNRLNDYDISTATLDVCTVQWIVSYPVDNITVSRPGPYYEGDEVRVTANGHPPPTITCTHSKFGDVVYVDPMMIKGHAGDKYTCTATSTVKGAAVSQSIMIDVSSTPPPEGCSSGCIAAILICVFGVPIIVVVVYFGGARCGFWVISPCCLPLVNCWNNCICCVICICVIKDKNDERANVRLTNSTSSGPEKPPRLSENPVKPNRPSSECQYAELRPEPIPHQLKPNPVNTPSTHYASVAIA